MFFATALITWSFEQVGVATGAVYGAYHYSGMLGPKLGAVPLLIPLAWFMMIYPSYLITTLIVDGHVFPLQMDIKQVGIRAFVAGTVSHHPLDPRSNGVRRPSQRTRGGFEPRQFTQRTKARSFQLQAESFGWPIIVRASVAQMMPGISQTAPPPFCLAYPQAAIRLLQY